jgi:predicted nucleotidyltransferase
MTHRLKVGFKTTPTEELLREMIAVVAREVDPEAIILFGSCVTGDAHFDSDVDLLVIETAPFGLGRDRRQEMARIWRALVGFTVAKDILVYSHEEVERWRESRNHIVGRALREGRLLYGTL